MPTLFIRNNTFQYRYLIYTHISIFWKFALQNKATNESKIIAISVIFACLLHYYLWLWFRYNHTTKLSNSDCLNGLMQLHVLTHILYIARLSTLSTYFFNEHRRLLNSLMLTGTLLWHSLNKSLLTKATENLHLQFTYLWNGVVLIGKLQVLE